MKIPNSFNRMGVSVGGDVDLTKPLTLTAEQAGATVKLTATGSPTTSGLQYRIDENADWSSYTIDTVITLTNIGDYVQFQNTQETLSADNSNKVAFVLSGYISASGNIQSMLNWIDETKDYCFIRMFQNCISLTTAPKLPAKTVAISAYVGLFIGCTSLTAAPELPATTLAKFCYTQMFYQCTALTTAPELPATTLDNGCYQQMFYQCTALTTAPELPATTLVSDCYYQMFTYCSSLTSINVNFTDWGSANRVTTSWVFGVSSSGIFTKPSALAETYERSKIPTGWTVVNK